MSFQCEKCGTDIHGSTGHKTNGLCSSCFCEATTETRIFSGKVVYMRNKPSDRPCSCCSGGQHVFCRFLSPSIMESVKEFIFNAKEGSDVEIKVVIKS